MVKPRSGCGRLEPDGRCMAIWTQCSPWKRHLIKGYPHHNVCGFNDEMDQLDHFHAKRCILEDLVHTVGWSSCECSASRIPLSLVCFVDCRLSTTHPVARCLVRHNSSEKAAAWPEGRLPAGWGGPCSDRSQKLVCSLASVDPALTAELLEGQGAGGGGRVWCQRKREEVWVPRWPNLPSSLAHQNQIMEMISHLWRLQPEPWLWRVCYPVSLQPFGIPFIGLQMGQCPLDIYLYL